MEREEGVSGTGNANASLTSHGLILTHTAGLPTAELPATGPSCLPDGGCSGQASTPCSEGEGGTPLGGGRPLEGLRWLGGDEGARSGPNIWSRLGEALEGPYSQERGGKQLSHLFSKYLLGTCSGPVLHVGGRIQDSN